jgi:outer membrane protein insertion porin family
VADLLQRRMLLTGLVLTALICTPTAAQTPEAAQPCPEIQPVQCIQFAGNTALSSDNLLGIADIRPAQPLSPMILAEAIDRIQKAYSDRGYIADFVYYEIQGEQPPRTLIFHIRELRVGEIEISGLRRTRDAVVRQFIRIEPGDIYNREAAGDAVDRLTGLGIFETIEVFLREGKEPGIAKLVFEVREAKTRRIDVGGSYAPQGEIILRLGYTEANFRGRAEQLGATLNIGSLQSKFSGGLSWLNPAVGGSPDNTFFIRGFSDVLFRFSNDLVTTPSSGRYFERRTGAQAIWTKYMSGSRELAYAFRYYNTNVQNYPFQFISADTPSPDGWIAMPSVRYVEDRRLRLIFPVAGTYSSALLEPGYSSPSSGKSGFIGKLQADRRWLFPLQRITPEALAESNPKPVRTFAIRLNAGVASGPLPFYEQFFVGGVDSLRGYRESRFWGRYFVLLNNEYRWPLSRNMVALAFVDVGDAWNSAYQIVPGVNTDYAQHVRFSPRVSYGIGAWYGLPQFGLVRLIFAKGEEWRFGFAAGESF